jgi:hypothetical protein
LKFIGAVQFGKEEVHTHLWIFDDYWLSILRVEAAWVAVLPIGYVANIGVVYGGEHQTRSIWRKPKSP